MYILPPHVLAFLDIFSQDKYRELGFLVGCVPVMKYYIKYIILNLPGFKNSVYLKILKVFMHHEAMLCTV